MMLPWINIEPPNIFEPMSFGTARDSPVSMDSLHRPLPTRTSPSTGIPDPGNTLTKSLTCTNSTSISLEETSRLLGKPPYTSIALVTLSDANSDNLSTVFFFERVSMYLPIRIIVIRAAEISKLWA